MSPEEKLKKIREKIQSWLDSLKDSGHDCITNMNVRVSDLKAYSNESERYGAFIDKMYENRVGIMILMTPRYSMWDTPIIEFDIQYSQLTPEDIDAIFKKLGLEETET